MQRFIRNEFIALVVTVLLAQLEGIQLERRRDDIHLRFHRPRRLRHAEAAKRARRRFVGVNGIGINLQIGNPIRSRGGVTRLLRHPRPDLRVGAGVEMNLAFARDQCPVFLEAGFHANHRGVLGDRVKDFFA